jgi:hypothetical protein
MKKTLLFLAFSLSFGLVIAQTYGNEWINYNQQYFSFKVAQNRPYRISHTVLSQAGIPVDVLSTGQYRIYGKEREVPIWINDANQNGFIDENEFIEFYAERNTGWLDSLLYENPEGIANAAFSLYSDTLTYFLTWSNDNNGLRFQVETDVAYTSYPSAPYLMHRVIIDLNAQYYEGPRVTGGSSSFFNEGEGWGRAQVNGITTPSINMNMTVTGYYTGADAPPVRLHTKVTSNSNAAASGVNNHRTVLSLNGNVFLDTVYNGFKQIRNTSFFPPSVFTSNTAVLTLSIPNTLGAVTDVQGFTYGQLDFAKNLNVGANNGLFRTVNNANATKATYQFTGLSGTGAHCYVWGGGIPKKLPVSIVSTNRFVVVPNAEDGEGQEIFIFSDAAITAIGSLNPVNGTGFFTNYSAQNLESALVFVYHNSLSAGVEEYKSYRESQAGGSYNVLLANVEELYMQYGGGVHGHALGIRRFSHQVYNQTNSKPVGLFLIGKGVREANELGGAQPGTRKSTISYANNLVPAFGYPSSDIGFTARLINNSWAPAIPTGRIAAKNNEELLSYLNKVKIHDQNQDPNSVYNSATKDWQKHVMHFGGGSSPSEINQLSGYLNVLGNKVQNNRFGGKTHTYIKQDSNPFNPTVLSQVSNRINDGVSVMTFFSHASGGGFEINIDQPETWQNFGRYPVVIGNSCYTGDMYMQTALTPAERFVLLEDKGAIAFVSTVKQGVAATLFQHSNFFYDEFCLNNYGATLSEQLSNTAAFLYATFPSNLLIESVAMQMNLHGDPMLSVNHHDRPEIEITPQSVLFNPSQIDLSTQEISLTLQVKNLGRSIMDTFSIEVRRNFPGQSADSVYTKQLPVLHYLDSVVFTMPVQPDVALGLNQFEILVDIPSQIEEQYDEFDNNTLLVNYLIDIGGILPVYPWDFAVIPEPNPTLLASTINPFAELKTYRFEIDTTDLFNSPQHRYFEVSSLGGVVAVQPNQWLRVSNNSNFPLVTPDSAVYFWRVSEVTGTEPLWIEQSFQYITGKKGWGQDHFYQFKKNTFSFLDYNRELRLREYLDFETTVQCNVWDNANSTPTWAGTNWYLNNTEIDYGLCQTTASIHVAVIDPVTLQPWYTRGLVNGVEVNSGNNFGNANDLSNSPPCRVRPDGYFIFRQTTAPQRQAFRDMIQNSIPDGHYILIYTPITTRYDLWEPEMFDLFASLQSDSIIPGRPNRSFIFFGQKGNYLFNKEEVAQFPGELITMNQTLPGISSFGMERSVVIGPAESWETVYWKQNSLESPITDSTVLTIFGLNLSGIEQSQLSLQFTPNDSLLNVNNQIDAAQKPYLQLKSFHWDELGQTPSQIDRWHVLYEELPEAAIDATNGYYWTVENNSVQEGEQISFAVDIRNIGNKHMDSLLVRYWVQDVNLNKQFIPYPRQDSLRVGQTLRDTISFSTQGMNGLRSFWIEVNPYINGSTVIKDQPEQFHFNNIAQIPFFVNRDIINPILDVTFDGVRILNGDIVSPKTEIVISLKDENPFLVMNSDADTSLFAIYLRDPMGIQKRVYFIDGNGQVNLEWIPASGNSNKFKIIYRGNFSMDGNYQLLVQGQDLSGNLSGDLDYRIEFEVINESTISYLMNYPNPFSTSTRFVFTLTGERVPDHMTIQIMTITGKVVREITLAELGPINIGRNITEYAWDGRDEFGDLLANGVYLYHVLTSLDGEKIKHRETGADEFFKKEFGKMYLMR